MFTPPEDFPDAAVLGALADGWAIDAVGLEYLAVGFGSHHWRATTASGERWFVTVDFDDRIDGLDAALSVARTLADGGFQGVVPPHPTVDDAVLRLAASGTHAFAIAVFPYLDAPALDDLPSPDLRPVVGLLADLHARTDAVRAVARTDSFELPGRNELLTLLDGVDDPWLAGPYGERVREQLAARSSGVRAALERYDRLVAGVDPEGWVITHGEPHERNILVTEGGYLLIDWDTARIAPPARDVWHLDGGALADEYTAATGRPITQDDLDLYVLRWDLGEIAAYAAEFAAPHGDTEDSAVAFGGLVESLERSIDAAAR